MDLPQDLTDLTQRIIAGMIRVHSSLGPGLLESIYRRCVAYELRGAGMKVDEERPIPLLYGEMKFDCAYRVDLIVNETVVIEIKSVEHLEPVHGAQLLTYLRLTDCPVGLLANFNTPVLKSGLRRFVNWRSSRLAPAPARNSQTTLDDSDSPSLLTLLTTPSPRRRRWAMVQAGSSIQSQGKR
jgi:GxxExxY protein